MHTKKDYTTYEDSISELFGTVVLSVDRVFSYRIKKLVFGLEFPLGIIVYHQPMWNLIINRWYIAHHWRKFYLLPKLNVYEKDKSSVRWGFYWSYFWMIYFR